MNLQIENQLRSQKYKNSGKKDGKPRYVKRGVIYYAKLGKNIGSAQNGYRPVLVIQEKKSNVTSPTVIIIPLTDALDDNGTPKKLLNTHVEINHPNLKMKSIIKTEYIRSLSKNRLLDPICDISNDPKMQEVEDKIKYSLNINQNY